MKMYLKINGDIKEYNILAVNEFTEQRQRMSILFRDPNSYDLNTGGILIVR